MGSDFDHSLLVENTQACSNPLSTQLLAESIRCNLICLKIQEYAREKFNEGREKRFLQMMDVLQKRIAYLPARLSFWHEFRRLFVQDLEQSATSGNIKTISHSDRLWLCEQVLCECAFPNNVKPGIGNDTGTLAIACNLLCDNKPATFVWLLAESVNEDRLETTDGTIVKPSDFDAFVDDLDIIELRARSMSADYSDLVGTTDRPLRNFAGKIAQTVLANVYWQRHATSISVVENAGILRLSHPDEEYATTHFNAGEVSFVSTEFGHELHILHKGERKVLHQFLNERTPVLVPARAPLIEPDFLPDIYNQVAINQMDEPQLLNTVDRSEATRAF